MTALDEETLKTITIMAADIKYIIRDNEKFCKKFDKYEERLNIIETRVHKIDNRQHTIYGKLAVVVAIISVLVSSFFGWVFYVVTHIGK